MRKERRIKKRRGEKRTDQEGRRNENIGEKRRKGGSLDVSNKNHQTSRERRDRRRKEDKSDLETAEIESRGGEKTCREEKKRNKYS